MSDIDPPDFEPSVEDLPATLPVFPLPGALLLPRGCLPLNIFEPRYLHLTLDALGAGRMFGMVQPRTMDDDDSALYPTGCLGRITSFDETEDGRLLISLVGVCRFRVERELEPVHGYRRVASDFAPFLADMAPDARHVIDRERFTAMLRTFFTRQGMEIDWDAVRDAPDEALVNSLAMICPFRPEEKQALLEAQGLDERYATMTTLLEMAIHAAPGDGAARQ